jgi:ABC-2 type transport system ATP-binding protein
MPDAFPPTPEHVVTIVDLVKTYSNGRPAVDHLNLDVHAGEIFGLIGPNGAGKSTTMRVLATLLRPTSGTVTIDGHDVVREQQDVRRIISYLPEDSGAYENLSGREYLGFMAGFYVEDKEPVVRTGIQIADLGDRIDSRIKEYSRGMKRRLLIARAMMTNPKLAILDEATAGLDVIHAQHVRSRIKEVVKGSQSTAIVSSHNLLEVDYLCDRVALMHQGRVLEIGTPKELKAKYRKENLEEVFVEAVKHAQ